MYRTNHKMYAYVTVHFPTGFWALICTFMNVNLYVYERQKVYDYDKRTLEHGIENTIFVAKCWDQEMWKISFCEPFLSSEEILEMRAVSVFGVIFLFFIDFECPVRRRRVSARCVLQKHCYGSQRTLLSSLFRTGLQSLQNRLQPWGRRDTKKGTEKVPNWFKLVNHGHHPLTRS